MDLFDACLFAMLKLRSCLKLSRRPHTIIGVCQNLTYLSTSLKTRTKHRKINGYSYTNEKHQEGISSTFSSQNTMENSDTHTTKNRNTFRYGLCHDHHILPTQFIPKSTPSPAWRHLRRFSEVASSIGRSACTRLQKCRATGNRLQLRTQSSPPTRLDRTILTHKCYNSKLFP